ncbi:MAG: amino acid adenylation domain-containing protein, partial [Gammaproteobacteria bacterium]|nr:amino acid adenylation domain-containing protein [Gammaproteobacteria bacterium]
RPELTAEKFIENPFVDSEIEKKTLYRTGDLVRYRLDGNLEFIGRTDDQVKIRGYRIELGEITNNISRIEGVKEAIVVVKTDQNNTKRLVAFWVSKKINENDILSESDIRHALSQDLPEYMMPSSFSQMSALPLTAHGKIDTRALPDVKFERSIAFQAAESDSERTLLQIWSDVLKKDNIGIHDNFFELGGDSILSIQIISRASDAGLTLQPRDVFEYQTISELARFAQDQVREIDTEQGVLEGQFGLSPIQSWFFEQEFTQASHWNQSVLLSVANKFDDTVLRKAFNALIKHHDAMHLMFNENNDAIEQNYQTPTALNFFHVENLSQTADDLILEVSLEIESRASQYQAQLDLEKGELFKVVLFVTDDANSNRLLIIAHHLIIDGVSWRILFSDLQKACSQILNHQPVNLGSKGSSFRQWQQALSLYAQDDKQQNVLNYWQTITKNIASSPSLIVDRENDVVITRDRKRVIHKLTQEQTQDLLEKVNSAYNTEVNDILLSAMLLALNENRELKTLTLMLEGHGRESISERLDISKTVGWFTSMYPVQINLSEQLSDEEPFNTKRLLSNTIKRVKEQLRNIPDNGIAYSALRYLHPDISVRQSLIVKPEISFNYLGQTANLFADNENFDFAKESTGESVSQDNQHPHLLDLSAIVIDGQLEISWVYSTRHFNENTIDELSTCYLQTLENIISHCLEADNSGFTPSDFPLIDSLEQIQLDELVKTIPTMTDIYPLSPLQEGMLFHSLYQQSEEVYIEQMQMSLRGDLNIDAFEQAWNQVIKNHTILRTGFFSQKGLSPLQVVLNESHCPVIMTDVKHWSESDINQFFENDRKQGFDLNTPPLMRLNLLRHKSEHYTFVWTSHHILADGWSFPLIIQEVMENYELLVSQKMMPGQSLAIQENSVDEYKHFIHYLKKQDSVAEAQYWKHYLNDISGATELPFASHHYDSKNTGRNKLLALELSQTKTRKLNDLTQQYRITINTLIQGLWAILLSKYSGETDILYGMTVSGRPSEIPGVEQKVGLYINSLPIKIQVKPEQSIGDWFFDIQQQQIEHQKYHHSGLNDIQAWTDIPAEQLFNQLFVFENYPVSDAISENKLSLNISDVTLVEKTNYPLTITTSVTERLKVEFGFNTNVYPDTAVIETIAEHFDILINSILNAEFECTHDVKVHELNWFSENEKHQVITQWNQTQHDYHDQACLHQMIEQHAQKTPDATAVVYDDLQNKQSLTFTQLNTQANQLAHYLIEQGIKTGDFVGLCFERHVDLVVAIAAILKAGAAYIPMDPEYPESRLKHILDDSQARFVLTHSSLQSKLNDFDVEVVSLDVKKELLVTYPVNNIDFDCSPEQAAYMIYTSGSTGLPKGVLCHHRGVMNLLSNFHRIQAFEAGEQHTLWTSISFDVSVYEFFSALTTGGTIHLLPESIRLDANLVFDYLSIHNISSTYLPPFFLSQYNQWLKNNPGKSVLKRMLVGVEPIVETLLIEIQKNVPGLQIINGYGPTEATICCTLYPVNSEQPSSLINTPIGKPVDNCQIYLLDEQGKPVPVGVNGEITIGGSGITHGYWNKPELTDEKFIVNPYSDKQGKLYRTGDMARYLHDGNIEFIGRTDAQVKLRGYRIELGEIESQLRGLTEIKESVAIIYQDNTLSDTSSKSDEARRLIAYVTLEEGALFDQNEVKVNLSKYLPDYMIPVSIIALDKFPLSPNGKIDKNALPEPDIEQVEYIEPQTETQIVLGNIWSDILHKDSNEPGNIGIKDNFFEIGGHSLLATQVITHINKHYTIELPIKALFDNPTIEKLALYVEKRESEELSTIKVTGIMPAVKRNEIPLSFAQERLWFIEQFDTNASLNNAYSIPVLLKLTGQLDVQKLEAAFSTLVHRHQVLSTRFVTIGGDARQERQQPSPWQLEYDDYSYLANGSNPVEDSSLAKGSSELEQKVQQRIQSEFERGFDLSKGNLFRTILLKVSEEEYMLMIIMHHIISDGWSMSILVDEFTKLYSGILEQKGNQNQPIQLLPRLPIQYADYSVWQRKWLSGERLEQQLSYWTEQLQDVPVLELPTDYSRPSVQSFKGKEFTFTLSKELNIKLNKLSSQQGSTLFMTLMASFSVLLNKYTRQNDICIGTPIANRNRKEIESLIGFFVNTLAIRQQVEPDKTFNQLLEQIKQQTLNAYDHQDVPFEKIVDNLNLERNLSYSPIFQVMFILQNTPLSGNDESLNHLKNLHIEEQKLENNTAKFDLTFTCVETKEGLRTTIEYRSELFKSETIERMASYFENILNSVSFDSEKKIADIEILSEAEKQQQLVTWQQPAIEHKPFMSLQAMFETQVVKTPDAIALRYSDKSLTYSQMNEQVNQFAHYLMKNGIQKGQSVGICLCRSLEMIISLYAVIKTGASYIPMDINYPRERLLYMLDETQSPLIITQSDLQEKLDIASERVFLVDKQWSELSSMLMDNLPEQNLREEALYTIFTSGSTGQPKGARVKHRGELNLLPWYIDDFNMSTDDNILLMSAFGFDLTQKNLFAPLMCGATLVIPEIDHYDNDYLIQLIEQENISWLNCAPSAFYPLIENDKHWSFVKSLRYVFLGGEPISLHKVQSWNQQSQCKLVNSYGPTECTDIASYHVLDTSKDESFPIGKANHNVQLYILNEELQLIPEGNIGELYIGGESLGLGYINQPELTSEAFVASPFATNQSPDELIYKTGDLVRYKNDGIIEYIGRVDFQVKLRGLRIELGEIEYQLVRNSKISNVAVRIVKDVNNIEQLVAYIVPAQNCSESLNINQLRGDLSEHLPDYMLPNFIIEMDSLPLTPNGKVDNKALPELNAIDHSDSYKAPETPVQMRLADIWSEILGVNPISCLDNFFNLGGNSLIAVRVLSKVNVIFSLQLTVKSLFEQPILEHFAALIDDQNEAGYKQIKEIIKPTQRPDVLPLSHAQNRLWFIEQMNPEDAAYNISSALKINGKLDVVIVENTFRQIIKRHESLRTNFLNEQGQAVQVIHRANQSVFQDWSLELIDISDCSSLEGEVMKRAESNAKTPFNLSNEPLFRVQLLKLSDEEYVLLFAMHHIISDGWSMEILQRDFAQYYQSYLDDAPVLLPELPIQYADFALWQEQKMDQKYIDSQLDFWKSYLKGIPNQLRLPTDYQRPAVATQNGSHYKFNIDISVFNKLKEQAKEQQVSMFMHLLCAWQILLAKYSEQDDICVGVPVSGREHEEIKDLIGFFVNVIVIRADLSLNPTFNELLTQTKLNTLDAFDHQAIPAEIVIDAVQPVRDTSHAPIAQVGFSYTDASGQDLANTIPGISFDSIEIETHSAKYDVTLSLSETEQGLRCELEFNTDLFKESTIANMAKHFGSLLDIISKEPERSVESISLLHTDELYSLLDCSIDEFEAIEPLASTQRDIFLQSLMNEDGLQNCMGYLTESNGDFKPDVWYDALELLYQYEPYLRAEFRASTESLTDLAYQCIRRNRTPNYQFVDLSFEYEPHKAAQKWIKKETYKSYKVTHTDLVTHYVFKIDEQRHYVAAAFHHIMLDGVGGYMLWKKLTYIYNALIDGSIDNKTYEHAEPLFLQYVNEHNQAMDHKNVLSFWNEQAKEIEPLSFTLPAYKQDETTRELRQSSTNPDEKVIQKTLVLNNTQWTEIRQFCRKQRTTPALYFKAIYGILLKSYCRAEKNFAIGDYIGSRKKQNMYSLGCYFEQTPYIFDVEAMSGELKDYLNVIKLHQKTVNKHLPISLSQQNKIFSTNLFRPTYNFYAWPYADEFIGNMQKGITYAPEVAETQLQFIVKAMENDATLILDYTSNSFSEKFFLQQIKAISDQFISGQTTLSQLQWINEKEKKQQLHDWQSDVVELKHHSVHEMFEQQVVKTPENIAVRCSGQSMTFNTLNEKANQLGRYLQQQGISRGDQVGICLGRSFEMIIAVLAAIKTGAGYVPMDVTYPEERLKFTLSEINAAMLITDTQMQDRLSFSSDKTFNVDKHLHELKSFSHENLNTESQLNDPFYTIFTSGSTGRPKGATVSHLCEINMLDWYTQTSYQLKEADNVLVMSAFGFDLTQKNIFAPLTTGATLILPDTNDYDPGYLCQLIEEEKVSWTTCTPSAFFPLIENPKIWSQLNTLDYVFFGGEPLKAEKMKAWKKQSHCQLINTFGPTECTDIATYHHLEELEHYEHRAIPIGKPNANVKLYILDDDLNLLPAGMTGEICIGGASVGLGYVTQPELTKEKFLPDPFSNEPDALLYKTGDLGRYQDNEGNIENVGRVDFQLKLRGLRIELGEIEYALQQQEGIKEVLVVEHNGQLVAYLTTDNNSKQQVDHSSVKNNLSRFLPQYMIPQHLIILDRFPLTGHGKIDRQSLPEPEAQSAAIYQKAETETQKILVEIWSMVLDISKIGINDSFFDLGGHSLIAVKLIAQIEEQFNCKLPIVQLMQTPTIADIADYLDQDGAEDRVNSQLVLLQDGGDNTPVFCIHGVGGNIHTFTSFAKHIGTDRAFYAIQSSGLIENSKIQNSISEMVNSYVQEIETISPDGPLILSGHSMGGVIAFEIASYFRQKGRVVEQLILLDSPSPKVIKEELRDQGFEWLDENTREQLQAYMELSFDHEFEQLSFDEKLDHMLAQIKEQISEDDNIVNRTIAVHIANFMAINRFDTDSLYDGDILLLKAQSNEGHSQYWNEFTSAQLTTIDVQGDHHTMLDSPNVEQLTNVICENWS